MLAKLGYGVIREQQRNYHAVGGGLARLSRVAVSSILSRPYSDAAPSAAPASRDGEVSTTSKDDKKQNLLFFSKAKPLSLDEGSPLRVVDPPPVGFSGMALKLLGFYSRESQLIRGSKTLYARISNHVERPELYASFVLEKSFRTTHAMLLLHVWLTLVRLRSEGKDGTKVGQNLYEQFNHDLEKRIVVAGVKMLISKWMKELEKNFYGAVAAYDGAMVPSAPKDELARALWRNVYAEDDALMPTGAEAAPVKSLARYVRREAACLALTDSESLMSGNIDFTSKFPVTASKEEPASFVDQEPVNPMPA
ncbi:unnamed protein product [Calypogeia fissa]